MDLNLILVFLCIFFVFGGGTLFWKIKQRQNGSSVVQRQHSQPSQSMATGDLDPLLSEWRAGKCKTLSGSCGKGEMSMTRSCLRDGSGDGQRCSEAGLHKVVDCYVECPRPKDVVDWGHPNDYPGLPIGSPAKGWYDISGQGQPNDYCRWVGDKNVFWACHSEKEPYLKADPSNITFSAGPANQMVPYHPALVAKMCPGHTAYLTVQDPDLQKSIANGMMARCGARCVYDYRNPKNGWWFNGTKWERIENMIVHPCGTQHRDEMMNAVNKYEKLFDVRNAWRK